MHSSTNPGSCCPGLSCNGVLHAEAFASCCPGVPVVSSISGVRSHRIYLYHML